MKKCCENLENRQEGLGPRGDVGGWKETEGVTHCAVCECRHMEVDADSFKIGVIGASI